MNIYRYIKGGGRTQSERFWLSLISGLDLLEKNYNNEKELYNFLLF